MGPGKMVNSRAMASSALLSINTMESSGRESLTATESQSGPTGSSIKVTTARAKRMALEFTNTWMVEYTRDSGATESRKEMA